MTTQTATIEKSEIVKIDPKEYGLEESKAAEISALFKPMLDKMVDLEKEYNQILALPIEDPATAPKAKKLRLMYVKVRTGTAEIHKGLKEFWLKGGRFVDGWKNAQLFASQGIESKLEEIELYAENKEKERIAQLQADREEALMPYNIENLSTLNLGGMSDQVWHNFLTGTRSNYEAKKEAERVAEEERIATAKAEAAERERVRVENERLKKEAEAHEKELAAEREKAAKEKAIADKAAKAEQERHDALMEAERKKAAKIKADADKLRAELKEQAEAKAKAERERIAAEKKAARAPEKQKIMLFAREIADIKLPEVTSPEAREILGDAKGLLMKVAVYLEEKGGQL